MNKNTILDCQSNANVSVESSVLFGECYFIDAFVLFAKSKAAYT